MTARFKESRRHFRRRVQGALADAGLQRALVEAMVGLKARRDLAFADYDFDAGREDLGRRRRDNLAHLPDLMDAFRRRLEAAGGTFHVAGDAREAREIIGRICVEAGAGVVTKSKSMATEEVELNQHLEGLGIEVVETDLGEYILQRLHQRPSHMIAPAIHLTLEDWARELKSDPDRNRIMETVRLELRDKFTQAAVGISGANAAIAETGTLMIVTNEGNADLTITLPRVHVALFGMDKLVASLEDAVSMLRMLPRSATGQTMTSYVNWVTGPSRSSDIGFVPLTGAHGPRELHCVVLDNGRSAMLKSPLFAEALTCIRCGACSNACPAFMAVGGHQFGHIYTGPIGLVVSPFHHGPDSTGLAQTLCTQCNACQDICPVGVPLPRQILEHRRAAGKSLSKRGLLELWSHPAAARAAMNAVSPLARALPSLPDALAEPPATKRHLEGGDGPPIVVFTSCLGERFQPRAVEALARVARAAGHQVVVPEGQWCCGLISANAGDFTRAARMLSDLAESLASSPGPVVTVSASCFGAIAEDSALWGMEEASRSPLAGRVIDSTRWLLDLISLHPDLLKPGPKVRVAYHDSCQSLRQLHLQAQPRRVLELAGYEVVDLDDPAACCGFGGTFSFEWPEVAARMGEWKMAAVNATGAGIVCSDNPGCLMQIGRAAARARTPVRVAHLVELVAERLTEPLQLSAI